MRFWPVSKTIPLEMGKVRQLLVGKRANLKKKIISVLINHFEIENTVMRDH